MWAKQKLLSLHVPRRLSLMGLYRLFLSDQQSSVEEAEHVNPQDVWSRISPAGNIYQINAFQYEHMLHEENLHSQMVEIAAEHAKLLDADSTDISGNPVLADLKTHVCKDSIRYKRLLHHLLSAVVAHDGRAGSGQGFPPLAEFLSSRAPERHCGICLLPGSTPARSAYVKNLCIACLLMIVQVMGPLLILIQNWHVDTNNLRNGKFVHLLTWKEFTCLRADAVNVTLMGTVFLILVYEITRNYAKQQMSESSKIMHLPAGTMWLVLGQLTNMACIMLTGLAMPLLFWSEMRPKDIVFDSMGLIFIFMLDDLTGDVLTYLEMDTQTFQQVSGWMVALLGQCPVELRDLVNPEPTDACNIWKIRIGDAGVISARTGSLCLTRLAPSQDVHSVESQALMKSEYFEDVSFEYRRKPGTPVVVPGTKGAGIILYIGWRFLHLVLGILEWLVPLVFFIASKPCAIEV